MMAILITASLFFVLIHFLISGTRLRDRLVNSLSEVGFRWLFSSLVAVSLVIMIIAYIHSDGTVIWADSLLPLPLILIGNLLAFALLVVGTLTPSPNSILSEQAFRRGKIQITGIQRITRHPGMLGIGLWALLHVLANGDSASLVFFGSLALLALLGPLSMDRKKLRLEEEPYAQVMAQTSYLPFVAILRGKNQLVWSEIGWKNPALAVLVFIVLVVLHPWIGGISIF